jgi:hypothetical protein
MRKITLLSTAMLAATFILLSYGPARAAAQTWVASTGSGSTCSRVAPCGTFAFAHAATDPGGEINCVDAGSYGAVTITKSISIVCDNTEAGISISASQGVTISAGASDIVTLNGLDIDGLGVAINGILFNSGAALHVNKVKIRNFAHGGIYAPPNAYVELYVTDSIITGTGNGAGAGNAGIIIAPVGSGSVNASINRVRLENNFAGIVVDGTSSAGVAVNATIVDSVIAGSQTDGVRAQSSAGFAAAFAFFDHSVASGNFGSGVTAVGGAATARIGDSTINLNVTGVSTASGGTAQSYKNNRISGNLNDGTPLPAVSLQ